MNWLRNFLRGVGSIFTIAPAPPPKIMSDEEALASDWKAVGDDIRKAAALHPSQESKPPTP